MQSPHHKFGPAELRAVRRQSRGLYWAVGVFSFFANILMLTGPLYMLQVYDRVLSARSLETLVALSLIVAFLYGVMGILDYARGRIMTRAGARFQTQLDRRVFDAVVSRSSTKSSQASATGLRDLEAVQQLMTSPVLMAAFDAPWTPVFLVGISLFHPWLGFLAIAGGGLLILISVANRTLSRNPILNANTASHHSAIVGEQICDEAEMVQALGMKDAASDRWHLSRSDALHQQVAASDITGAFGAFTKTFRLLLQSAMLGLGAYLVLENELSPGAMIAGSILLGRALSPIELAIGQWAVVQKALKGWENLGQLLSDIPVRQARTELPKPQPKLDVQQLTVFAPGASQAALRMVNFELRPGQAVGVIGPSGAGKSSLARALTGIWPPSAGHIRLDGADLDQYDPRKLGRYIGYLPQRVQLFDGTVAQNIARLSADPDSKMVIAAAQKAAVHEMVLSLPEGYDTILSANGGRLSGGQIQRIGLARAMYSDPVLLVLDEPNANLDNDGSIALNRAIREMKAQGKSVLIMAHRPAAILECDLLLVLDRGARTAFGPRDDVLRGSVVKHNPFQQSHAQGDVR